MKSAETTAAVIEPAVNPVSVHPAAWETIKAQLQTLQTLQPQFDEMTTRLRTAERELDWFKKNHPLANVKILMLQTQLLAAQDRIRELQDHLLEIRRLASKTAV